MAATSRIREMDDSESLEEAHARIAHLEAELAEARRSVRMYQALGRCLAEFSVSFAESQASMAAMAQSIQDERSSAHLAAAAAGETRDAAGHMSERLKALADSSHAAVGDVDHLHGESKRITEMTELIGRIASQTHLLSMNAAVEAARAGEQGRGFAVVAKEVQSLSAQTDRATKEIGPLITGIQAASTKVKEHMDAFSADSLQFSESGAQMAEKMSSALDLTHRMEGTISGAALRTFVELAKLDHLIFKFEIYKVFFGLSEKSADDLAHHTGCRLGKWYYQGEGKQLYAGLAGYREIEGPHLEVHASGKEALHSFAHGDLGAAIRALGAMEKASLKVVRGLEKMAVNGGG